MRNDKKIIAAALVINEPAFFGDLGQSGGSTVRGRNKECPEIAVVFTDGGSVRRSADDGIVVGIQRFAAGNPGGIAAFADAQAGNQLFLFAKPGEASYIPFRPAVENLFGFFVGQIVNVDFKF